MDEAIGKIERSEALSIGPQQQDAAEAPAGRSESGLLATPDESSELGAHGWLEGDVGPEKPRELPSIANAVQAVGDAGDSNELLLLGLLDQHKMHGYELHEFLEHRLSFLSSLKKPTAYRMLDRMFAEGLVERTAERSGRRPERMVYQLTMAGRERFMRLLREQLAATDRPLAPANVALIFSDRLAPDERTGLLRKRRQSVAELRDLLSNALGFHDAGSGARLVLHHDLAHLAAELGWLDRVIAGEVDF